MYTGTRNLPDVIIDMDRGIGSIGNGILERYMLVNQITAKKLIHEVPENPYPFYCDRKGR